MYKYLLFISIVCFSHACRDSGKSEEKSSVSTTVSDSSPIEYPDALEKVFENHGSLAKWKKMRSMSYEIVKDEGNETQMIDLQTRAERIKGSNFESGYDGKNYWVVADTSYKGNPKFYTNLMFYFYAMPFVLADEGIIYSKVKAVSFEGVDYPGYRISYNDGIGVSPEDEYFIHYDPETYEMAWLGYTVTFYSGEKSDKIKWIRYNDWKQFNGLKLPNSLSWYKTEEGKITELRNTRYFANVKVSEEAFPLNTLARPKEAKIVD